MSKILFKYGAMNAGKSASLLINEYQLRKSGVKTLIIKPSTDTRHPGVASRIGISRKADYTLDKANQRHVLSLLKKAVQNGRMIFVDEAQFILPNFIKKLNLIIRENPESNSIVFAYGLLTNIHNELFDGSKAWIEVADKIEMQHAICQEPGCSKCATCNYLPKADLIKGDTIIGDKEYKSLCAEHFYIHTKEDN